MADERTGIKYIGKEPYYKDRIFGTGLVWKSGEAQGPHVVIEVDAAAGVDGNRPADLEEVRH